MNPPDRAGPWSGNPPGNPRPKPPRAKVLDPTDRPAPPEAPRSDADPLAFLAPYPTDPPAPSEADCRVSSTWAQSAHVHDRPSKRKVAGSVLRGVWKVIFWTCSALGVGIAIILVFGLVFAGSARGKARAAIDALKRIEARTEIGVTYADYHRVLGEQYAQIKPFLESSDAEALPKVAAHISNAVECYKDAGFYWGLKLKYPTIDRSDDDAKMQRDWRDASVAITAADRELGG